MSTHQTSKGQPPVRYNSLVAHPDLDARMRLKQATTAVPMFGSVRQAATLREGQGHLENDVSPCDVLFISHKFPIEEAGAFIKQCKEIKCSQDAAFILVLPPSQGSSDVANQVLQGFDGFLVEPFSVNSLVEITLLAERVKKERGEARAKVAIQMLVNEMIEQLDLVCFMKSSGYEITKSMTKLKDLANNLVTMGGEYLSICEEMIIDQFSEAPLPKRVYQVKKYGGVSDRVRKRMEAKILSDIDKRHDSLKTSK